MFIAFTFSPELVGVAMVGITLQFPVPKVDGINVDGNVDGITLFMGVAVVCCSGRFISTSAIGTECIWASKGRKHKNGLATFSFLAKGHHAESRSVS